MVGKALAETESREQKVVLDRIAAMLSRLGGRGYRVKEDVVAYGFEETDFDTDTVPESDADIDTDIEEAKARHQEDASDTRS